MAGIGFELRRLSRQENLLGPVAAIGHASVVAAGPWMFTILALVLIGGVAEPKLGIDAVATFRVVVVYAFSISLVATAPVIIVATRRLGDLLYLRQPERVPALLWSTCALSMTATGLAAALVFGLASNTTPELIASGVSISAIAAGIWSAMLFCGAIRDFSSITLGFAAGLVVSVIAAGAAAFQASDPLLLVGGFNAGLAIIFFALLRRLALSFPAPSTAGFTDLVAHLRAIGRLPTLAFGALAAALAIWVDKWIIWFSPFAEAVDLGLVHSPVYDSPMFVAYLTIIPSLALFITVLETTFFERFCAYFQAIDQHATLAQIRTRRLELKRDVLRMLLRLMVLQAALCIICVSLAPVLVQAVGLNYAQVPILRFGILGAMFHVLFVICTSLVLFFDRHVEYALLQVAFLAMQAGFTLAFLYFGQSFLGLGYLLASLVAALASVTTLESILNDVDFLTFSAAAAKS